MFLSNFLNQVAESYIARVISAEQIENVRIMTPKIYGMENSCFRCVYARGCVVINLTFFLRGVVTVGALGAVVLFSSPLLSDI